MSWTEPSHYIGQILKVWWFGEGRWFKGGDVVLFEKRDMESISRQEKGSRKKGGRHRDCTMVMWLNGMGCGWTVQVSEPD